MIEAHKWRLWFTSKLACESDASKERVLSNVLIVVRITTTIDEKKKVQTAI
jgi:hypothetical protein